MTCPKQHHFHTADPHSQNTGDFLVRTPFHVCQPQSVPLSRRKQRHGAVDVVSFLTALGVIGFGGGRLDGLIR